MQSLALDLILLLNELSFLGNFVYKVYLLLHCVFSSNFVDSNV